MKQKQNPWSWVPSLYFAEGLPYIIVMTLSAIMYKRLGVSNTDLALYTSWLYLPWVIKPLWSPVVDLLKTKRWWIVVMQMVIGVGLAGVAFSVPAPEFFQYTLAFFWLLAFSSATHDIAADGFYLLALPSGEQSYFVGIRSTFYRLAMLTGQGLLVIIAGQLEVATGLAPVKVEVVANPSAVMTTIATSEKEIQPSSDISFFAPHKVELPVQHLPTAIVDSMTQVVKTHNVEHHFYQNEVVNTIVDNSKDGIWTTYITNPSSHVLNRFFGKEKKVVTAVSGNAAIIEIRLSSKPAKGEQVVMNFGFEEGDKSIGLAQNYRYEFTEQNWDKPALALVKVDPKLKVKSSAIFVGRSGNIVFAWSVVMGIIAVFFVLVSIYHRFALARDVEDKRRNSEQTSFFAEFAETFISFFQKKHIGIAIAFMLLYRLAESQIVKMASPFLLDAREVGGLGVTTGELGFIYGTAGLLALTLGGILGGVLVSKKGLKYWLWWMALAMNLPNAAYLALSVLTPDSLFYISTAVVVEQFGYGFGFTAYMLFMIYIAEGKHKTAHFALTTGFMALGMMIPGMVSGWLQEIIGYQNFFVWVLICTLPGFAVLPFLKIDADFGKKQQEEEN